MIGIRAACIPHAYPPSISLLIGAIQTVGPNTPASLLGSIGTAVLTIGEASAQGPPSKSTFDAIEGKVHVTRLSLKSRRPDVADVCWDQ